MSQAKKGRKGINFISVEKGDIFGDRADYLSKGKRKQRMKFA